MDTRLVGLEHVPSVMEVAARANDLIGKEVPGSPGYIVIKVIQFELTQHGSRYDALLLVEIDEPQEPLNLKAADVEAIVEITSAVDEPEQTA
ncbi:hypothetical protein [Dictyobacter arantiisoli]|uniref:Uncharacterized protein n=1 Tax=Dictyobacter arantiisoli TaxID=2014874 RepID=A0A5A5TEN7_9CHLR|nr:hypothetical protein [Dictyobacter arantiisoli]GCF10030.1 hypothetical protein KDI_35940 [Dictyobacter arantiisoli]